MSKAQAFQEAQYPSYQEFLAFTKEFNEHPSFGNLFSVHFAAPRVLMNNASDTLGSRTRRLDPGQGKATFVFGLCFSSLDLMDSVPGARGRALAP